LGKVSTLVSPRVAACGALGGALRSLHTDGGMDNKRTPGMGHNHRRHNRWTNRLVPSK
jgi:hypothetical protein